ncbi:unnamed protein product, partial [marine sediment metagenome]
EGKNKAIHAYDSILWKVRTGFLTLIFAGFGIILTGLLKEGADFSKAQQYIFVMLLVSSGLSISAIIIDINYLHRKFRVIKHLNDLLKSASTLNTDQSEEKLNEIRQYFKVSGDSGGNFYKDVKGYPGALTVAILVYFIPVLVIWGGWAYYVVCM